MSDGSHGDGGDRARGAGESGGRGGGLSLSATQLDRYSRHILLDGVESDGQAALLDSRVLVVGAGGLGAPALQYLAAAGVGTLGIADDDEVERSNLQRQVIHRDADVGRPKVDSAREFVAALNPDVDVRTHGVRVAPANAEDLVAEYDFVIDASDNFPTRYLLNDACQLRDVPLAFGAVHRFGGQVSTFPPGGPCYRCVFPEAPPPGTVPDCATAGVLGVLPGTVGCLQATEAMKWLLGLGETLAGRLLVYDALAPGFEALSVERNPACPVCGDDAPAIESVTEVAYDGGCRV
jgi:adenylyltransferase/sulfurtransferase